MGKPAHSLFCDLFYKEPVNV